MRVLDPKQPQRQSFSSAPRRSGRRWYSKKRPWIATFGLLLIGGVVAGFLLMSGTSPIKQASKTNDVSANTVVNQNLQTLPKKGTLKIFTGEQFRDTYDNFAYPNTSHINEDTPITGDVAADQRIKALAESRGYKRRSAPVTNTFIDVGKGYMLQQRAAQPWLDLQVAAKPAGINLGLTAAYRSADEQKQIFLQRLAAQNIQVATIASGAHDAQINQVLRTTAIPGYSRHHTGYTVDISCENQPRNAFENTVCFQWLSANNYENAKKHGWIPSYPEGAGQQGPDPESWEYVWVGADTVIE